MPAVRRARIKDYKMITYCRKTHEAVVFFEGDACPMCGLVEKLAAVQEENTRLDAELEAARDRLAEM